MTPPPPPFGFSRSRDDLRFDPALDDEPLADARAALAQGRWTAARSLLAETGDDWDRRGHRLVVLGEGGASATWAREWQLAEPGSSDAAALLASATVFRAVAGEGEARTGPRGLPRRRRAHMRPTPPRGSAC